MAHTHDNHGMVVHLDEGQRHVAVALVVQGAEDEQVLVGHECGVGEEVLEQHAVARGIVTAEQPVVDVPEHAHGAGDGGREVERIGKAVGVPPGDVQRIPK